MKLELNGIYKEGPKNLKSNMHNLIEKKSQEFSKKASDKISNTVAKHVTGTPTINKSGGSNITLNYKEFCKIFMFLKLASDFNSTDRPSETVSLMRAAALIQANVRYSYDKNQNHDFNITEAYTIVNVSAVVEMGTLFPWTASVNTDDNGNAELEADFSEIGKKTVKINYSGICGY